MKHNQPQAVTVININRHGEQFTPAGYLVSRAEHPELYKLLERVTPSAQEVQKVCR